HLGRLWGGSAGGRIGSIEQAAERVHPEDRAAFLEQCQRCRATGADFALAFRVVWPDGSVHWMEGRGRCVTAADGRPGHMTGACREITQRKNQEMALRQAQQEAAEASRIKDEFLAALSHELRTPLAPVLLSTQ